MPLCVAWEVLELALDTHGFDGAARTPCSISDYLVPCCSDSIMDATTCEDTLTSATLRTSPSGGSK